MVNISIFAKPASFARPLGKGEEHLYRGSSIIRGEQVAVQIGAKLNPRSGYEDDICIFVKPNAQKLYSGVVKLAQRAYIDIIDSPNLVSYVKRNPQVGAIICSRIDYERLKRKLANKVVFIPQHHCNFERVKRKRKQVTTVGVIGVPGLFNMLPKDFEARLTEKGFNVLKYGSFRNRQDVVDFYQKIDIQVVWRPWRRSLSNPLKIVNAASFGIPTVAYQEAVFDEVDGCYLPVKTEDGLIEQVWQLKASPQLYVACRERCLDKAEEYHLEKIGEKYKSLD